MDNTLTSDLSRGDKISRYEAAIRICHLIELKAEIGAYMRDQHNKDVVLGHIHSEINELRALTRKGNSNVR